MVAIKFTYESTHHIRKETCGGRDSEYSHSEIKRSNYTIVVPCDSPEWREAAERNLYYHAGNNRDKAFRVAVIESFPIDCIISETKRL